MRTKPIPQHRDVPMLAAPGAASGDARRGLSCLTGSGDVGGGDDGGDGGRGAVMWDGWGWDWGNDVGGCGRAANRRADEPVAVVPGKGSVCGCLPAAAAGSVASWKTTTIVAMQAG